MSTDNSRVQTTDFGFVSKFLGMTLDEALSTWAAETLFDKLYIVMRMLSCLPPWEIEGRQALQQLLQKKLRASPDLRQKLFLFYTCQLTKGVLQDLSFSQDSTYFFNNLGEILKKHHPKKGVSIKVSGDLVVRNPLQMGLPCIQSIIFLDIIHTKDKIPNYVCSLTHEMGKESRFLLTCRDQRESMGVDTLFEWMNSKFLAAKVYYENTPVICAKPKTIGINNNLGVIECETSAWQDLANFFTREETNFDFEHTVEEVLASAVAFWVTGYLLGTGNPEAKYYVSTDRKVFAIFSGPMFKNSDVNLLKDSEFNSLFLEYREEFASSCLKAFDAIRECQGEFLAILTLLFEPLHEESVIRSYVDKVLAMDPVLVKEAILSQF